MKETAISKIKSQIRYYESKLKMKSWDSDEPERSFIRGAIFGLEQAIISVENS